MASFKPVSMVWIPITVFGECGPNYLTVIPIPGLVSGVSVEGVVSDQSVTDGGTEVGAGLLASTAHHSEQGD